MVIKKKKVLYDKWLSKKIMEDYHEYKKSQLITREKRRGLTSINIWEAQKALSLGI